MTIPALARRWHYPSEEVHQLLADGRSPDSYGARHAAERARYLLRQADRRVPVLADHLAAVCPDGYPGGGDGGDGGMTATEAAVFARTRYTEAADLALRLMGKLSNQAAIGASGVLYAPQAVVWHLEDLLGVCDAWERPTAAEKAAARCTGGVGLRGALEWGRPECDNIASRRGLCDACRKREDRWARREQEVA